MMAPSSTTTSVAAATTRPRDRLAWVKLRLMQVFWPACVYESYSAATRHAHDMSTLRASKPVLDAEDRVVCFLGINAGILSGSLGTQTSGIAPNVSSCIAPVEELTVVPWAAISNSLTPADYAALCRRHFVNEECILRAEKNSVFQRACSQAREYAKRVETDSDACELIMAAIRGRLPVTKVKPQPEMATPSVVTTEKKPTTGPPSIGEVRTAITQQPLAPSHGAVSSRALPAAVVTACWARMRAAGWMTLAHGGTATLYAMPGTAFADFKPNITVFDSLEAACVKFLGSWARGNAAEAKSQIPDSECEELNSLLWETMAANGWQTMSSADEKWFIMPNTPFNQCVPNVTIFRSQNRAVAKYLESLGVHTSTTQPGTNEVKVADADSSGDVAVDSDDDDTVMDEDTQENAPDGESEDEEHNGELEEDEETDEDGNEDEKDQECVLRIKPKRRTRITSTKSRGVSQRSRKSTSSSCSSRTIRKSYTAPTVTIPPFKCTAGKVEVELRTRGWYWKPVKFSVAADGYMYYKPECREKDEKSIVPFKDCFPGRVALEKYLEDSGLYEVIREKLRHDHERAYRPQASTSSKTSKQGRQAVKPVKRAVVIEITDEDEEESEGEKTHQVYSTNTVKSDGPRVAKAETSEFKKMKEGAARRKPAPEQIKRVVEKSSRRQSLEASKQLKHEDVKFGHVWEELQQEGWFYRIGKFEYDYCKPCCKNNSAAKPGVDYFTSQLLCEDYLTTSGVWDDVVSRILAKHNGEVIRAPPSEVGTGALPIKRKVSVSDAEHTPKASKKAKSLLSFHDYHTPPTDKKRQTEPTSLDVEATQDLSALESNPAISPESATNKARQDLAGASCPSLSRNLAPSFTPSPSADKRIKLAESPVHPRSREMNASERAQAAISRLHLSFAPSEIHHREDEAKQIQEFCQDCFLNRQGGSMYLSGAPGCGKSALLRSLQAKLHVAYEESGHDTSSLVWSHINAMGLKDFGQLFCQLAESLTANPHVDGESAFSILETRTSGARCKQPKTLILILDEIDALGRRSSMERDLCRLFELAHRRSQQFLLIGIANQVDFTERHLATLRQQLPNVKPTVVIFQPYSFQTISSILMDRLGGQEEASSMMNSNGIAFIARKVAAISGDVRLALDIARRVLQQRLHSPASPPSQATPGPVSLAEIVKVIKAVLESKSKISVSSLPRNLQMILFASTRLVSQTGSGQDLYRLDDLYDSYCDVSHDAGVFRPLSRGEFKIGLETLSAEGMVAPGELRRQLIKLHCTPSELLQGFKTDPYFSRLI